LPSGPEGGKAEVGKGLGLGEGGSSAYSAGGLTGETGAAVQKGWSGTGLIQRKSGKEAKGLVEGGRGKRSSSQSRGQGLFLLDLRKPGGTDRVKRRRRGTAFF